MGSRLLRQDWNQPHQVHPWASGGASRDSVRQSLGLLTQSRRKKFYTSILHVIEFQKRGMPHCKMHNWIDELDAPASAVRGNMWWQPYAHKFRIEQRILDCTRSSWLTWFMFRVGLSTKIPLAWTATNAQSLSQCNTDKRPSSTTTATPLTDNR